MAAGSSRAGVADAEPRHPDPRGPRRRARAAHDRPGRRAARGAPLDRLPAAAHARGPRPRDARRRRTRRARRAHGGARRGRRTRPAGRGASRAHRGRERPRHDLLPVGARPRGVRHPRLGRAPARGRLGRAAAGTRHPVGVGAPGKAILAALPESSWPADLDEARRAELRTARRARVGDQPRRGDPRAAVGGGAADAPARRPRRRRRRLPRGSALGRADRGAHRRASRGRSAPRSAAEPATASRGGSGEAVVDEADVVLGDALRHVRRRPPPGRPTPCTPSRGRGTPPRRLRRSPPRRTRSSRAARRRSRSRSPRRDGPAASHSCHHATNASYSPSTRVYRRS